MLLTNHSHNCGLVSWNERAKKPGNVYCTVRSVSFLPLPCLLPFLSCLFFLYMLPFLYPFMPSLLPSISFSFAYCFCPRLPYLFALAFPAFYPLTIVHSTVLPFASVLLLLVNLWCFTRSVIR